MHAPLIHNATPLPADHPCADCTARSTAVCGVLKCEDLARFRNLGRTMKLKEGESLYHEGDESSRVFTVTSGTLKLYKLLPDGRRQVTGFMFPGDFLGMTVGDEHAFTAQSLEDTQLCWFPRSRFDGFIEENPEMEHGLYQLAAHELAAAQQQMVLLGRKTANERVATFFLGLLQRSEKVNGGTSTMIDLPMSRSDIADYLGLTKETVSRVLASLKKQRLIRLDALNRIEILDRAGLTDMAEGLSGD
jgi:CRP/FNR family transcriptional regulator